MAATIPKMSAPTLKGLIWFSACWLPIVGILPSHPSGAFAKESGDFGVTADAREILQTATAGIKSLRNPSPGLRPPD